MQPRYDLSEAEVLKGATSHGDASETMAAKKGSSKIEALTALPGVGAATAKKLVEAKIDSVSKIAGAGSKKLQDAGLSAAVAKKVSAAAKAASKAKTATKATASKAKSATKATATKAKSASKKVAAKANKSTKAAASKASSATKKVASKAKSTAKAAAVKGRDAVKKTVPAKKSKDGRKGSTLSVPRSVRDMPWFKKK
ncbi:MAG TPA: hypothetical protein HA356_04685 [Candidatus Poseidoniaceae archaeon]|nr:hypothetical protein [Candidatus Poseidoniaceae archaeon]